MNNIHEFERGSIEWRMEVLTVMKTMQWKALEEMKQWISVPHQPAYQKPANAAAWIGDLVNLMEAKLEEDRGV